MKFNNKAFTLPELVVGMVASSLVMLAVGNFLINYYQNYQDLKGDQKEFSDTTFGLKSLQKIIFENGKYFTFNDEIFSGGSCQGDITSGVGLDTLCYSKFGFVVENSGGQEEEFHVELVDCNLGEKKGKQLVYKGSTDIIPLLGSCMMSDHGYDIKHKIEFINDDIKEKIFRYYIYTENGIYKQTFFIH